MIRRIILGLVGCFAFVWAFADPIDFEVIKVENSELVTAMVLHGPVTESEVFTPGWQHRFWQTDLSISAFRLPNYGDQVVFNYSARHKSAPHADEPPLGPAYSSNIVLHPGCPYLFTFGGDTHGEHVDAFSEVAFSQAGVASTITKFTWMSTGIHFSSEANLRRAMRRGGTCSSVEAVPPSSSGAHAVVSLTLLPSGEAVLSVGANGILASDILLTELRLGPRGTEGIPVMQLDPPDKWTSGEQGCLVAMRYKQFPDFLVEPLRQGLLSVNIATWQWPLGEVRGWLLPVNQPMAVPAKPFVTDRL
ncbi:MAG: hypothetical protein KF884_02730 [Fimbriimonadaceae bacterium]|nr:hypothetical protein [Fimbriimonadaceae bacterium]QYK59011.1 MAG: hypothetical protein KF884_02730 [Fimbriimonadaceae bacterium]